MAGAIVAIVVVVFLLILVARTVRIVPQARAGIVERLGRAQRLGHLARRCGRHHAVAAAIAGDRRRRCGRGTGRARRDGGWGGGRGAADAGIGRCLAQLVAALTAQDRDAALLRSGGAGKQRAGQQDEGAISVLHARNRRHLNTASQWQVAHLAAMQGGA